MNAEVRGGTLTWTGEGDWTPASICVDWHYRDNFVYECKLEQDDNDGNVWHISEENCIQDSSRIEC